MATTIKRKTAGKKKATTPAAEPTTGVAPENLTDGPGTDEDLDQAIARRAYEIYEASGRPEGRQEEHWRQAEREIRAQRNLQL